MERLAYSWLNDDELAKRVDELRQAAHEAPLAEWSKDHRGHSAIVNHTNAWAQRGNEWLAAKQELERRRR